MNVLQLDTPVRAPWCRSIELESISYELGSIVLRVLEDSSEKSWLIRFTNIQGLKITTFESAYEILKKLNEDGSFFEIKRSKWFNSLGVDKLEYMKKSRHFVVCCYDEVVEVAAWQVEFIESKAES